MCFTNGELRKAAELRQTEGVGTIEALQRSMSAEGVNHTISADDPDPALTPAELETLRGDMGPAPAGPTFTADTESDKVEAAA